MTREQYIRTTDFTRDLMNRLPGGRRLLRVPTFLCAFIYLYSLLTLMLRADERLIRALLVPAACFVIVTAIRPIINRPRPYDAFGVAPVGSFRPGKGKSMPSRHAACAAAIAFAVIYAFPVPLFSAGMFLLCVLIAALRVLAGQHYTSDVVAALLLSAVISLIGYSL